LNPKLKTTKFDIKKLETSLWREMYFDILNHLGVDHECDGQTDKRSDRQIGL